MDLGLKDKIALVAAASKGLGKAVARELAREGATVAICARNQETLHKTQKQISSVTGQTVRSYPADVTDKKQIRALVNKITGEFGRVDILVTNAGGPPSGQIEDVSPEDYSSSLALNLMSAVYLCYEVMPFMKKQGWGRIIHITSVSAKQPIDTLVLSNTSRAGVLGFSKSLSNQLAPFGITVNCVCPGYTRTERVEDLARTFADSGKGTVHDFYSSIEKNIPVGRVASPEEFAAAVTFLASERASYITGTALPIDGGFIKALY